MTSKFFIDKELGGDHRYTVGFPYDPAAVQIISKQIAKSERKFNPDNKSWTVDLKTPSAMRSFLTFLRAHGDSSAHQIIASLEETLDAKKAIAKASRAEDADIDIPLPEGVTLYPFQRAGVKFGLSVSARLQKVLYGDDLGLGKTPEAIALSNCRPESRNILIICPSSVKLNWRNEWKVFSVKQDLTIGIAKGKTKSKREFPNTDIVIINYDIVKAHRDLIDAREWDEVIVDEAHYLQNDKALRTKAILGAKAYKQSPAVEPIKSKYWTFLTATPISNRPMNAWTLFSFIDPQTFSSRHAYGTTFCGGHNSGWGWVYDGATNLDQLQEIIRSSFMIRRLKADVLTELPPITRQIIELEVEGTSSLLAAEKKVMDRITADLQRIYEKAKAAKEKSNDDEYRQAIEQLRQANKAAFEEIAILRKKAAIAKAPTVIDHLKEAIPDRKVVLFAHHKEVVKMYRDAFADCCVVVDGSCKDEQRQEAKERFQNDPSVRVFLGTLAAAEGITLTASDYTVMAELQLSPGKIMQMEGRNHRIGQKNNVLCAYFVLSGSVDVQIAKLLKWKIENIEKALDVESDTETEQMNMLESLIADYRPTAKQAAEKIGEARKEAAETAIDDEQARFILQALRLLAARCDGAQAEDSAGFNKFDSHFGKDLASRPRLSQKQAAAGFKLVRKYQGQLPEDLLQMCGIEPSKKSKAA